MFAQCAIAPSVQLGWNNYPITIRKSQFFEYSEKSRNQFIIPFFARLALFQALVETERGTKNNTDKIRLNTRSKNASKISLLYLQSIFILLAAFNHSQRFFFCFSLLFFSRKMPCVTNNVQSKFTEKKSVLQPAKQPKKHTHRMSSYEAHKTKRVESIIHLR